MIALNGTNLFFAMLAGYVLLFLVQQLQEKTVFDGRFVVSGSKPRDVNQRLVWLYQHLI